MEKEIRLPSTVSAVPGKIKLYPFQRGIADAIGDPTIERVSILKSARIGYTTILNGAIAHFVVNDPSLILVYLPNDDMARSFVISDMEPTFEDSPALKGALSGDKARTSGGRDRTTMLMRQFTGGTLKIMSAETTRNFRAHNARVVILDEIDDMKTLKEGDPIALAVGRTAQFADRKIISGSTPVEEETSRIIAQYENSDKRIFEVRCVECNDYSEIAWKDIHWPEGKPEEAYWGCPSCGCAIEHKHKSTMVARGRWRATKPEVVGHAGFKINSLSSPIPHAAWGILAKEFLLAKNDPGLLQKFVNTVLGEGWKTDGDRIDEFELQESAEPFGLGGAEQHGFPEDVLAVTAGVDLQEDRGEITYVGHNEIGQQLILGHEVIYGRYEDNEFWTDIDAAITRKWQHPLGGMIGIDAVALDSSSGSMMRHVYDFAKPRMRRKVFAIKGDDGRRPFILRSKAQKKDPLWIVGVDSIKDAILNRIRAGKIIRYSKDLPAVWFEQFTGEQIVVKMLKGQPQRKWERIPGRRNEALDCVVYALAVKELVTINWTVRRGQLSTNPAPANDNAPVASKPRVRQSSWI
jgi:phage terminase large subunit GpA-like protein